MSSASLFDLEQILSPIPGEVDTGVDVRMDPSPTSTYQTIKAARSAARAAERNSIHDGHSNEADDHWRVIKNLAPELIAAQAKDLEVACWYTEALLRSNGFQGLRDGFRLILGLIENFWENLYPMPDEDGIETRVSCLAGLNGEGAEGVLIAPIRRTEITEGSTIGPFTYWEYQQALDCQKVADEKSKQAKIAKLGFSLDNIETAIRETANPFFENIRDDLTDAIAHYRQVSHLLDEHCGTYDAPPTRTIIEILEECLGAINHLAKDKLPLPETPQETPTEEPDQPEEQAANIQQHVQISAPTHLENREAAFRQLVDIAEFFRKNEPHSPVSYMLQKAVKWGRMPLNELMQELIPDTSSRSHFSEITGVLAEDE
ncbi:type VI secretion system protein TssA [Teredinibacter turnerae]|uniref:type VI secretion system protein TssA n=1 Tax=Teredinibacter turnerae TaxID=2426 RepID=UPI00037C385D|nr:type VI secretion system protein TssA [Teredinibacter turnerae]